MRLILDLDIHRIIGIFFFFQERVKDVKNQRVN